MLKNIFKAQTQRIINRLEGFYTVEAALLMPMFFLVFFFFVLYGDLSI